MPAIHNMSAETAKERLAELLATIAKVKEKWSMSEDAPVALVFEVGQDGFYITRECLLFWMKASIDSTHVMQNHGSI